MDCSKPDTVELRVRGTVLGVLRNVGGTAVELQIKKGCKLFSININDAMAYGYPLILERYYDPDEITTQVGMEIDR